MSQYKEQDGYIGTSMIWDKIVNINYREQGCCPVLIHGATLV